MVSIDDLRARLKRELAPTNDDVDGILGHAFKLSVGGELRPASDGATFPSYDPSTGRLLKRVPCASEQDINLAIERAQIAQKHWREVPYIERARLVRTAADCLRKNADLFALLDALESGNLYAAMRLDAFEAADLIEYFCSIGFELKGEVSQLDSNLHYTRREPYGVVLRLLPFNHPIAGVGAALAGPLLTGNALILKPSPHTSLSALLFGELIGDLLPAGLMSIISGSNERVAMPLVEHRGISRISLIGSTDVGKAIMRSASTRLIPLTLELGGKNPLIIFPDADLDRAADIAMAGMNYAWQSASCSATSRILVHNSVKADFEERLIARMSNIRVGSPLNPASQMGAISFEALFERCLHYIDLGLAEGATLAVGGKPIVAPELKDGLFLAPALFVNANKSMRISQDEIFGPIVTSISWSDYASMIELVNESSYGLTAVIVTGDLDMAHRAAAELEVGYVEINGPVSWALGSPFGGYKQSGFGLERTIDELASYTRVKSVNIRLRPSSSFAL